MSTTELATRDPEGLAETATAQQAAMARAQIEARYVLAMRKPRNIEDARTALLRDCERPRFADVARYRRPVGRDATGRQQTIEGFSIRFAEAAIRHLGNVDVQSAIVLDDADKLILRIAVVDLESNVSYGGDVTIAKTVERKKLRRGQKALAARTNSYGDTVYIVPASEGDLRTKSAAEISKAIRTSGLRLIPGWLLDEAEDRIKMTIEDGVRNDPDGARRAVIDGFAGIGIRAAQLEAYLGRPLDGATAADLRELREIFTTVRDGVATWRDCMAAKRGEEPEDDRAAKQTDDLRRKIEKARAKPKASRPRKPAPEPEPEDEEAAPYSGPPEDLDREPGDDSDEEGAP